MLDLDSRYKVEGYGGVAWYPVGYEKIRDRDYEWSGIEVDNLDRVRMVMVGDDRVFIFDIEEISKLDEDEYCHECGQIGCKGDMLG